MDAERCICCGAIIPEGRMTCPMCEQKEMKYGSILQSQDATVEEVKEAYEWLFTTAEND